MNQKKYMTKKSVNETLHDEMISSRQKMQDMIIGLGYKTVLIEIAHSR